MRFRYSRWDGTQDPLGPDVPASDVLEELADEILMGGDADQAMQRLLRRGMQGRFSGMDALRRRLREQRQREEAMLDLTGPLEDVRERLEEILERERAELGFRDDDDARAREAFLGALPPDAPGQIGELREYRFVDATAQRMFERMLGFANHVGLYAEETGPRGEALGNFPRAFTHLALISAAVNLDRALGAGA
jgi:uncharacterized protein with von Willebrand factor type A (vWA) domain